MTEQHLHVLQHSLGLDRYGRGHSYRNYFVTGEGTTDFPLCTDLVAAGLMTRRPGNALTGGDDCFRVTEAGRAYVVEHSPAPPPEPILTRSQRRYRAFLSEDHGMRFGEWLKSRPAP